MAALLCIAAVCIAALGAATVARRDAITTAHAELETLASTMASRLDQHMFERYREIQNIAGLAPLQRTWNGDPATIRGVLKQLQDSLPDYAWIGFATPDGTVKAATKGMLEGVSVAQRPWFVNGLKGPTVEDVHDAKLLDKLLRTSPDQAPFRFVDVAMPVFAENGELAGVLGAHMSWSWADDVRKTVLVDQQTETPSELLVLGADGSILVGPDENSVLSNATLTKDGENRVFVDESEVLTALVATKGQAEYPGLGWVVAARKPIHQVYASANALVTRIMLIGAVVAFLTAIVAWLLAGTVTSPLKQLTSAIDGIGRNPAAGTIERQHGSLDVLRLSAAMRSLLRRVGTAEAEQAEARDRISALESAVEEQIRMSDEKTRRLGADIHTLQVLADTDALTGLLNRRAFHPFAQDAWDYFNRYGRNFSILMLDADHFKRVNDTFGHAAGDEVIRTIGDIVSNEIRSTDKVARFGGEEFVVLLRETDEKAAQTLANRIREKIADTRIEYALDAFSVTVSIGCALAEKTDRDIEDVIHRADRALYAAKAGGRNRISMKLDGDSDRIAA